MRSNVYSHFKTAFNDALNKHSPDKKSPSELADNPVWKAMESAIIKISIRVSEQIQEEIY